MTHGHEVLIHLWQLELPETTTIFCQPQFLEQELTLTHLLELEIERDLKNPQIDSTLQVKRLPSISFSIRLASSFRGASARLGIAQKFQSNSRWFRSVTQLDPKFGWKRHISSIDTFVNGMINVFSSGRCVLLNKGARSWGV